GVQMSVEEWNSDQLRALGVLLQGDCSPVDQKGDCIVGDHLLILLNAHDHPVEFFVPEPMRQVPGIERLFDTSDGDIQVTPFDPREPYLLRPRSMALFRRQIAGEIPWHPFSPASDTGGS
ncbi:MAG: hypothetical protein ACK50P_09185, partial [Planctomycetaceae bacterium]